MKTGKIILTEKQKDTLSLLMYKASFLKNNYSRKCIEHYRKRMKNKGYNVVFCFQYTGVRQYDIILESLEDMNKKMDW